MWIRKSELKNILDQDGGFLERQAARDRKREEHRLACRLWVKKQKLAEAETEEKIKKLLLRALPDAGSEEEKS